jgi:hypothetical protein
MDVHAAAEEILDSFIQHSEIFQIQMSRTTPILRLPIDECKSGIGPISRPDVAWLLNFIKRVGDEKDCRRRRPPPPRGHLSKRWWRGRGAIVAGCALPATVMMGAGDLNYGCEGVGDEEAVVAVRSRCNREIQACAGSRATITTEAGRATTPSMVLIMGPRAASTGKNAESRQGKVYRWRKSGQISSLWFMLK